MSLYVMISVTFDANMDMQNKGHANWPFFLQVDIAGDGSTQAVELYAPSGCL